MQFEVTGKSTRERKLHQLENLLNIEIPISGSVLLIWWLLPGSILFLIYAAAIVLLPIFVILLCILLFQLGKYGWFSSLLLFVVLPLIAVPFLNDGSATYPIYYIYPLAFFGFYSITLRVVAPNWE